jgi:hypothetical protein
MGVALGSAQTSQDEREETEQEEERRIEGREHGRASVESLSSLGDVLWRW